MSTPDRWSARRSNRVEPSDANAHVTWPIGPAAAPESLSHSPTSPRPREDLARRPVRRLERVARELSERDRAVLQDVASFRFLSTGQLQRLHFVEHATEGAASRICRRVLRRLSELAVIEPLERRVGGIRAGSASFVWRVGPVGDRLLRQTAGAGRRLRRKEPSLRYLDHSLAIADCYLQLIEVARTGRLELLTRETEPNCWRPYMGPHGANEVLKPDLYVVTASGDYEDSWFVEVDRDTESLPTVLKKCAQYARYRQTGREQAARGVFPVALWVVPDDRRRQALLTGIRRASSLDGELFRVTTVERFAETVTGETA